MTTLHYVIGPSAGWATPTAAEVVAGTMAGGATAAAAGAQDSPDVTTDPFSFSAPAVGLLESLAYRIAFAWTDGAEFSNVAVSAAFSMLGPFAQRAAIPAGSLMPAYRARPAALSMARRPRT